MRSMNTDNAIAERRPSRRRCGWAFTLIEVMTALAILAFVASSVLVVVDRNIASAGDSALRLEAFELARENLENVLSSASVEETVDLGRSDKYPDITWKTVIEAFGDPIGGATWIRAVCSAEYKDSAGQSQKVELEHWITDLTDQQADQLGDQPQSLEELTAEQLLTTPEEAAQYAGVDTDTLEKWVENGLLVTPDGGYIKHNLDVYVRSDGKPADAEKQQQVQSIEDLARTLKSQQGEENAPGEQPEPMGPGDVMKMLKQRGER